MERVKRTKDLERDGDFPITNSAGVFAPRRSSMGRRRGEDSFYNNAPAIGDGENSMTTGNNDLLASMDPKVRARMLDSIKTLVFFDEIGALH